MVFVILHSVSGSYRRCHAWCTGWFLRCRDRVIFEEAWFAEDARDLESFIFLARRTPTGLPRHLSYNPFELVAMAFPRHGRGRNVGAKSSNASRQIFTLEKQFFKSCFSQSFLASLFVYERPDVVAALA